MTAMSRACGLAIFLFSLSSTTTTTRWYDNIVDISPVVSGFSARTPSPGRRPSRRTDEDDGGSYPKSSGSSSSSVGGGGGERDRGGGRGSGRGGGGGRGGRDVIGRSPPRTARRVVDDRPPRELRRREGKGGGYYRREDEDDEYRSKTTPFSPPSSSTSSTSSSSSAINCPHFGTCPGCVKDDNVMDIDVVSSSKMYFSSPSVRRHYAPSRDRRRDSYDIDDDDDDDDEFYRVVIPSSIVGWRTQAKLAIAPKSLWSRSSGCVVGLYQRNSHDVIGIPECRVHHPSVNRAVEVLTQATSNVRTPAYNEDTGEGLLRYAMVRVETHTGKVCMTLVMNADKYKDAQPQLSQLAKEMRNIDRDLFHSIWCHCNDAKGNAIFAKDVTRWHPVDGMPYLRERIPGSSGVVSGAKYGTRDDNEIEAGEEEEDGGYLYFSPHVFRQANMDGFADIAREVREAIPSGSKVCELYAGVGLLGLSALLHHGRMDSEVGGGGGGLGWLRCSDENPENAKCFERSVNSMPSRITGRSPRTGRMFRGVGDGRGGRGGRHARMQRRGGGAGRTASSAADGGGDLLSIKDLMDSVLSDGGDGRRRAAAPPSEVEPSERVTYMQASAASALYRGQALGANVLIVDPPRKGLDEVVLQQLSQRINPNQMYAEKSTLISHLPRHTVNWTNDVRSLIYVSCGFDALARDLDALLTSNAGWKLESATGYVLFPGSNHVETVVVLRR